MTLGKQQNTMGVEIKPANSYRLADSPLVLSGGNNKMVLLKYYKYFHMLNN